jgi:beta-galactosidase
MPLLARLFIVAAFACFSALRMSAAPDTHATDQPAASPATRERLSLDAGWRFHLGDITPPVIRGHRDSYRNAKAGVAWGAAAPDFDDSDWRKLDLPHDWVVEGPFDPKENISQGYRPRGIAWYRRYLRLDESDRGRHLELQFDGIATHATIWVNGILAHRSWCGYTPSYIDITSFANYGDQLNSIVVRVDANAQEGWWYEGGGIYRHTWLVKRNPVHVVTHGLHANPVRDSAGAWSVPVEVTLHNIERVPAPVTVRAELHDPEGNVLRSAESAPLVPVLDQSIVRLPLPVTAPRLWSVDTPTLYTVRVTVRRDGRVIDTTSTRCGFRTIRFDPKLGFFLNDQPLKLKGTCNHQDHAGVGVAVPAALWDFRIRRLKEMGSNAYRSAHNPPAPEFLEAADRLGLLVMDENRNFNPTPDYLEQLRLLVRRDRNHPSVILWSVFNEEPMQGTPQGREMVRRMVAEVRKLDSTRPVTAAMNGGMMNPEGVFEAVDVMGFNYVHRSYDSFHARFPDLPITSAEDTSAFMTRGEFETDPKRNVVSSYDTEYASWGRSHREAWKLIAERPYLAGGFVWTGFDYRGEPQRLEWPSVSSVFGIMDVCGFPKTAFYIHQAHWIENRPVLALAPHWNWPGREGQPIKVIAMTNADRVTLSLNGSPLGERATTPLDYAEWQVPYAPGRLEAVAYKNGAEVARAVIETTGEAVALRLAPDRPFLAGDGRDAMPITVSAVDSAGRVVPRSAPLVTFTVSGPGENIGHGNGDHNCHDPEHGPDRRLFHGLGQLIVRSHSTAGELLVRATAPGLAPAELKLPVQAVAPVPSVPPAAPIFTIASWRVAPAEATRPDPLQVMSGADMNTWSALRPGSLQTTPQGQWALYRASFTPWKHFRAAGGTLLLRAVQGSGEVWIDGVKVAEKTTPAAADLRLPLPAAPGARVITLLLRAGADGRTGLASATITEAGPR